MKIQASTLFILTLCQKQLIRIGAIIRANPSIDVNEQDFTAAKDIINNKLVTNGITQFTRFFDDRIGSFDLQQKICDAAEVSVTALFVPDLPDALIENAVSISEALHIPLLTTKAVTVARNTSYLVTLGISNKTKQKVLRKLIKSIVGSDLVVMQCNTEMDLVTRMEIKFKYYMFNINANIDIVMEQVSLLISDNNVRNIIIQCPTIQTRTVLSAALHANLIRSDIRFILSEPNALITWDASYLPRELKLNATTWLPFDVSSSTYRSFEQKLLRGRECQENCPMLISPELPKVTLDKVYLYDALMLVGKALSNKTINASPVPCRKRNGLNAIWTQGSTIARILKQFDQTTGLSGPIKIRQTGARSGEELLIYEFSNQSFTQLGQFSNETIRYQGAQLLHVNMVDKNQNENND